MGTLGSRISGNLGPSLAIASQQEAFVPADSKNFISATCEKEASAAAEARTRRFVRCCAPETFLPARHPGGVLDTAEMIRNPRLCTLRRWRLALPRSAARVNFHKRGFLADIFLFIIFFSSLECSAGLQAFLFPIV